MTVTTVPAGHFVGGRALTQAPTTGSDVRALETILQSIITDVNLAGVALDTIKTPIAAAADFPLLTTIADGQIYRVTAGCTDNAGATHTNTGQVFLVGDEIIWNGTNWTVLGGGVSTATPAAVGTAAAGTSQIKSNEDHIHAHGNQLGGTLHADAVAGVSSGFMSAAMLTTQVAHGVSIAAIVNDHVRSVHAAINAKTDESEVTAVLSGTAGMHWMPTHIAIECTATGGALNGDCTINVGTTAGGTDIASGLVTTGINAVGMIRMVPITTVAVAHIAADATMYVNVEAPETGAGTLTLKVTLCGRQF